MASAGNGVNVTITAAEIFNARNDGGKCTTFLVRNRSGSSGVVLVNVEGLHKATEWMGIEAGAEQAFRFNHNGLGVVTVKTASDTATIDYGVIAKIVNM